MITIKQTISRANRSTLVGKQAKVAKYIFHAYPACRSISFAQRGSVGKGSLRDPKPDEIIYIIARGQTPSSLRLGSALGKSQYAGFADLEVNFHQGLPTTLEELFVKLALEIQYETSLFPKIPPHFFTSQNLYSTRKGLSLGLQVARAGRFKEIPRSFITTKLLALEGHYTSVLSTVVLRKGGFTSLPLSCLTAELLHKRLGDYTTALQHAISSGVYSKLNPKLVLHPLLLTDNEYRLRVVRTALRSGMTKLDPSITAGLVTTLHDGVELASMLEDGPLPSYLIPQLKQEHFLYQYHPVLVTLFLEGKEANIPKEVFTDMKALDLAAPLLDDGMTGTKLIDIPAYKPWRDSLPV